MPDRAKHVMSLIRQVRGNKDYVAEFGTRMRGAGEYAEMMAQRFNRACKKSQLSLDRQALLTCSKFRVPCDNPQLDLLAL